MANTQWGGRVRMSAHTPTRPNLCCSSSQAAQLMERPHGPVQESGVDSLLAQQTRRDSAVAPLVRVPGTSEGPGVVTSSAVARAANTSVDEVCIDSFVNPSSCKRTTCIQLARVPFSIHQRTRLAIGSNTSCAVDLSAQAGGQGSVPGLAWRVLGDGSAASVPRARANAVRAI
jgi:hypothetical protein